MPVTVGSVVVRTESNGTLLKLVIWISVAGGREHQDIKTQVVQYTQCDLISLNETWLKDDTETIDIPGYTWFGHNRQLVNKRALKGSGGVGILAANYLFSEFDIFVLDKQFDGMLTLSLCHKETEYKFILVTAYLPPDNSLYGRDATGFFSHLINLIYMHTDYDAIYIAGDLNGRIGNKSDFIECVDDIPKRTAIDIDFKGHGEAILDFCFESKFCVVNGRIDPVNDNFTFISSKGSAVVDYFLTSHDHLHSLRSFEVISMTNVTDNIGIHALGNAPNKISDHSMLLMDVCVRVYDAIELHEAERSDHRVRPDVSTQIIERIEDSRSTQTEIDQIYKDIVNVYTSEMTKIFGIKNDNPHSNKKFRFTKKERWDEGLTLMFKEMQIKQSTLTLRRKNLNKISNVNRLSLNWNGTNW